MPDVTGYRAKVGVIVPSSMSVATLEHTNNEPVTTRVLGLIDAAPVNTGPVLFTITEADSVVEPPSASVTVTLHTIVSPD